MTRNLKALGLALVAVLAIGAVAAQGAMANVEHTFTSKVQNTDYTGHATTNHTFSAGGVSVVCEEAAFTGSEEGKATHTLPAAAEYSECSVGGILEAEVNMMGCEYVFHTETTEEEAPQATPGVEAADVTLECPSEATNGGPTIIAPGCTLDIQPNQTLHGVHYENDNGNVIVEAKVHKIMYDVTEEGLCGLVGLEEGTHSDGTYEGTATVEGFEAGEPHDEAHQVEIGVTTP